MEIKPANMRLNYLILLIISFVVYGMTISNRYNFDDELVTMNNPMTSANSEVTILDVFSSSYHEAYGFSYGYRPITTLSFYLEHRIFNESPFVSHTINLLLYILAVLLLYYLLTKVFTSTNHYILLFIALLFAVHSVHSEVVSSIKNRDEILSFLFLEFSVFFALKWWSKKNTYFLIGLFLSVTLSILSKKTTVSVILLIPILFYLRYPLKVVPFLLLSLSFILPVSLFLFNLDPQKGILVFTFCTLIYLFVYYLKSNQFFNRTFKEKTIYFFIPLVSSLILFLLGGLFREQTLWSLAILILLFYVNDRSNIIFALLGLLTILGYLVFDNNWYLLYNVILLPVLIIHPLSNRSFRVVFTVLLISTIVHFIYEKGEYIYGIIYVIPLIVFFTAKINRFLPLIISGLSIIIGGVFFSVAFFHLGLIIGSLALFSIDINLTKSRLQKVVILWTLILLIFSSYKYYQSNGDLFQTLEDKQQIVEKVENNSNQSLQEGRMLEYMENTLVVPHTLEQRIATGAVILGEYFRLMIFPNELSFYYGYSKVQTSDFTDYRVWISLLTYLMLIFLMIYAIDKQPLISIGVLWYLVAILLFSNWPVLVAGMVGERLAFVASLGICIAIGGVLNWISPNFNLRKPKSIEFIALSVLVILSVRTMARNRLWVSSETLMTNDISHLKNSAQANYMLAMTTVKDVVEKTTPSKESHRRLDRAIGHFKKAIEIYPDFFNYHYDLGRTYIVLENYGEAKRAFLKAHKLEPDAIISLDELVKTSFDLEEYEDVIKYGKLYLSQSNRSEVIYELVAYSAFLIRDFELSTAIIKEGLMYHPNNQNLHGLLMDVNKEIESNY